MRGGLPVQENGQKAVVVVETDDGNIIASGDCGGDGGSRSIASLRGSWWCQFDRRWVARVLPATSRSGGSTRGGKSSINVRKIARK